MVRLQREEAFPVSRWPRKCGARAEEPAVASLAHVFVRICWGGRLLAIYFHYVCILKRVMVGWPSRVERVVKGSPGRAYKVDGAVEARRNIFVIFASLAAFTSVGYDRNPSLRCLGRLRMERVIASM